MDPVKVLKPGSQLICLKDLSNKRSRLSSSSSSSFSQPQVISEEKTASQSSSSSSSSSSAADADNDKEGACGSSGGGGGGGEGEGREAEMKPGSLPVVSKSPVPAVTPVGQRPLSLRVVTSTVADGKTSRTTTKRKCDDRPEPTGLGRGSAVKTASPTPSPTSALRQMAAVDAAPDAAAGDETTSAGEDSPASPTKQLSKLKRFLKTIHHLGSDISFEIGDLVRNLVLKLVNNNISIEKFHEKLHKATNFPLRPFVIPFLKTTLPSLQQELSDQAELSRLTLHQYLSKNEHIIFHTDQPRSTVSPSDNTNDSSTKIPLRDTIDSGPKRPHADRRHGTNCDDLSPVSKRPRTRTSPPLADHPSDPRYVRMESLPFGLGFPGTRPVLVQDPGTTHLLTTHLEREFIQRETERCFSNYNRHNRLAFCPDQLDRQEDEWKYVEHLLKCIVGMVEKCQRALVVLQERSVRSREEVSSGGGRIRRTVDSLAGQVDIKRYASDLFANLDFYASTDEQRLEALRNAEESVKDFRRQAVSELQKAMAASEAKAREMLTADRMKMEQTLEEVRRKTRDEVTCILNKQEDSDENCWNCGRVASQTCSGCNVARYCGAFCQHRHWESHHRVCGVKSTGAAVPSSSSFGPSAPYETRPRSSALLSPFDARAGDGVTVRPSAVNGETRSAATAFRSRSRTKSLSPVLLQTTIKQETI